MSRSLLLTARIAEGSQVQISRVPGKTVNGAGYWLPSLENAREAKLARLREIHEYASVGKSTPSLSVRRKDEKLQNWLALVLREHLSKYTPHVSSLCATFLKTDELPLSWT